MDVAGATERCDMGEDMKGACAMIRQLDGDIYDARPPELEGIEAALALSPAIWGVFGSTGIGAIDTPLMLAAGSLDTITPIDTNTTPIYEHMPEPKSLAMFGAAGHYAFSNFCDIPDIESLTKGVIAECSEDFVDHHLAMDITAELSLAWFDAFLHDDWTALDALTSEEIATRWPDVLTWTVDAVAVP